MSAVMPVKSGLVISINDISVITGNIEFLPREAIDYFEYPMFSDLQLRNDFIVYLQKFSMEDRNVSIAITEKSILSAFAMLEFMPFDTQIFGFNVYRVSKIFLGRNNNLDNHKLLSIILDEIYTQIVKKQIQYLVLSLNANSSHHSFLFNSMMGAGFRYINTLITFKMTKEDFSKVTLHKPQTDDILVRLANHHDRDAIVNLAKKSYKINRYHLDPVLDRVTCDRLHATSVDNSLMCGFADVVIVAEYKDQVVGYYTAKKAYHPELKATFGYGLLTAVDETVRGRGIYSQINNSILQWYHDNTDVAEMGTYINNTPIHKTFTNNGLSIVRGVHQLSKMLKP